MRENEGDERERERKSEGMIVGGDKRRRWQHDDCCGGVCDGSGTAESRKRTKLKTYIRFNITLKKDEEKVIKKAARRRKIGINKVCIGRFNAYVYT